MEDLTWKVQPFYRDFPLEVVICEDEAGGKGERGGILKYWRKPKPF